MQDLRTRFGIILVLSLLPILIYASWLAISTAKIIPVAISIASLGFAFVALWFATNSLVFKHLKAIEKASREFSTGDLSARIGELPSAPVRIKELADSFDTMADTISQREAAMMDSLVEKEILLREIHHRVKNNLQIIISLLNMQERKTKDPNGIEIIREARNRINAIALVHRSLYEGDDLSVIDVSNFLDSLIRELQIGLGADALNISIKTELESQMLIPDKAIPVALFIVEALTNSIQHGVPKGGEVVVSLKNSEDDIIVSVWDSGPGISQSNDSVMGTGTKLIKGFARQLSGQIKTDNKNGYCVSLIFKAEN